MKCAPLIICVGVLFLVFTAKSQSPVKYFERSQFTEEDSIRLLADFGKNKILIARYALPSLVALSYYPELRNTRIRFICKPAHAPLTTRPTFPSVMYLPAKKTFTITISNGTIPKLSPVLLRQMNFNEQVGVIGHELAHVSDFSRQNVLHLAGSGIGHIFSSRYIDRFEFRTDSICLARGLGYQLLAWSTFVRREMHTINWRGADNVDKMPMEQERYMNPSTIMKRMQEDSLYSGPR